MPHWMIKAATQRAIGLLPMRHRVNEFLQNHLTRSTSLTDQRFEFKLDECRQHLEHFFELRPDARAGFTAFELGPGWYPTVAAGLFLCGATEVWTCDVAPLLRLDRARLFLEKVCTTHDRGELLRILPQALPDRVEQVRDLLRRDRWKTAEQLLEAMNIHVHVADARHTRLPDASIDFVVSIGVLLHIPPAILREILAEFHRIGKADMAQSHFIDMMDLFAYFDRSISPLNFLKFSDRRWSWIDNPIIPMNRLRISDYRRLFAEAGFEVTRETHYAMAKPEDLDRVQLDQRFQSYSREDLLTLMSYVVSRKAVSARSISSSEMANAM